MAISFRHHGTICQVVAASRNRSPIDQFSQPPQGVQIDSRPIAKHYELAASRIQHPTGNNESQTIFKLDDDRRFLSSPQPTDNLHFAARERVESISDTRRTKLMSSVLRRCAIRMPRT
jgi:hypothetical protein